MVECKEGVLGVVFGLGFYREDPEQLGPDIQYVFGFGTVSWRVG